MNFGQRDILRERDRRDMSRVSRLSRNRDARDRRDMSRMSRMSRTRSASPAPAVLSDERDYRIVEQPKPRSSPFSPPMTPTAGRRP
jgi:hypothetical protein